MELDNSNNEKENTEPKWTDHDEVMLEKSVKELEKGRITAHETVIKKFRKQFTK